MAKDSSFDVVSQVDIQEVDNAFGQAKKEIAQRYDLKDSGASISLDKANKTLTVSAPSDFVAKQVIDIISSKLIKRGIDLGAVNWGKVEAASGGTVKQTASIVDGIDKETAGKINKDIKATKLKVKVTIEGDKLRVSGPKLDTLQELLLFSRNKITASRFSSPTIANAGNFSKKSFVHHVGVCEERSRFGSYGCTSRAGGLRGSRSGAA